MSPIGAVVFAGCAVALGLLPRRWGAAPLIASACCLTRAQSIDVGPFTFTVMELLVLVGVARVVVRQESPVNGIGAQDWLVLLWAIWMVVSVVGHRNPIDQVVKRLGLAFDGFGLYLLFRTFSRSEADFLATSRFIAMLLVPVAIAMLVERLTGHNVFSLLGGVPAVAQVRDGAFRARGPFNVPILAGTVGAVSLPLAVGIWRLGATMSAVGGVACVVMIYSSASSGPILSAAAAALAVCWWPYRRRMRETIWGVVCLYLALQAVMKAPPYYLMARIDLTGSSTGWHRARLIDSSIRHLSEWWLVGTDYTRHWMPSGITWSADHTDITNDYLKMGVLGGFPLMLLFIGILAAAFMAIGRVVREAQTQPGSATFSAWCCGASLFSFAVTAISVSFVDQSIVFLYFMLGAAASAWRSCSGLALSPPVARRRRWRQTSSASVVGGSREANVSDIEGARRGGRRRFRRHGTSTG